MKTETQDRLEKQSEIENLVVYESLRNEIISIQEIRATYNVYMYTVYVVLFGLGVEFSSIFFAVSFIILISFQAKINHCKYSITRISAYIRIFFEEERNDIHWEKFYFDEATTEIRKKLDHKLTNVISSTSTVQLGIISLASYIVKTGYQWIVLKYTWNENMFEMIVGGVILIVSIACVRLLIVLNGDGDYDINENNIKELDRVFGEYKKGGYTITRLGNEPENVNGKANE